MCGKGKITHGIPKGSNLKGPLEKGVKADKMREILAKIDWLSLLYLVCVLCQSA